MKRWVFLLLAVFLLMGRANAAEVPRDLIKALPEGTEDLIELADPTDPGGLARGVGRILEDIKGKVGEVLRQRTRGATSVLLVVVLCAAVEGFSQGTGGKTALFLPMVGALSVTLLTAGSLDSLMGLGAETIGELNRFSKALLPTLAAATAASGAVTTATVQQVTTVFFVDLLLNLVDGLLLPMVYLYTGALAAAACLPESRLGAIAEPGSAPARRTARQYGSPKRPSPGWCRWWAESSPRPRRQCWWGQGC